MSIYRRKQSWYYDFQYKGERYTGSLGQVSKSVAKEELTRKKAEVVEGRLNPAKARKSPRIEAFAKEYLDWSQDNKKPRSWERDDTSIKALTTSFKGKTLSQITPWLVEQHKRRRKAEGRSPQTIKLELACLKAMFNKALQWKKATENPMREVKMPVVHNMRIRFLEQDEEAQLLPVCEGHLRDLVTTALHTGFRRNELFSLKPSDIDFARRLVQVQAAYAKNGTSRSVPMTKTLEPVLRRLVEQAQDNDSDHLFLNCHGQPYRSCRNAFEYAVKPAGITNFHFHDLRHTFASRLVMSGVDIRTVQELMGHKSISMTLRYAHLSPDHKQQAMEAMDRAFSEKSPANFHNTPESEGLSKLEKAV